MTSINKGSTRVVATLQDEVFFTTSSWSGRFYQLQQLGFFSYHLIPRRRPGFDPMSVSRVAPDWDLPDALPTEL